jgi:MSHA biogenesis protein MshQ
MLNGTLNLSSGTFAVHDFDGAGTVNITGGTLQVSHDFNATGPVNMSGGLIQEGHDFHATVANFKPTGGTVEFTASSGSGAFPLGTYQFYNVLIDAGVNPGFDNKANTFIIDGNLVNNGSPTLTHQNTTVIFSGTSPQTISGSSATTFQNLTINNPTGLTLASPITVDGTLTLGQGVLATGGGQISFGAGAAVSGGGAGSYISGNVQKSVGVGKNQTITFPIGNASGYAPITLSSLNVTTAGSLTVTMTTGQHPNICSSGINPAKDANCYWTITAGSGLVVSSYSATFSFVAGDLDAGANPLNFVARRYSAGWTVPATGTLTATSITVTGLTAFGDFAVGETGCTMIGCGKLSGQGMPVSFVGVPGHAYTLQASTNLKTWVNIGTATAGTNGLCQYVDADAGNYSTRFYRTVY